MNFFRLSKAVVRASFQCLPVACEVSEGCCMRGEMINIATVVARFEIDFGEDRGALEAVEEFLCAGNGIPILDRLFVEGAEVDTEAESTPFLADK